MPKRSAAVPRQALRMQAEDPPMLRRRGRPFAIYQYAQLRLAQDFNGPIFQFPAL